MSCRRQTSRGAMPKNYSYSVGIPFQRHPSYRAINSARTHFRQRGRCYLGVKYRGIKLLLIPSDLAQIPSRIAETNIPLTSGGRPSRLSPASVGPSLLLGAWATPLREYWRNQESLRLPHTQASVCTRPSTLKQPCAIFQHGRMLNKYHQVKGAFRLFFVIFSLLLLLLPFFQFCLRNTIFFSFILSYWR